jgi:hypothetical protein
MCLFGAARITHRAQRIVSIASQWHMRMVSAALHHKPAATLAFSTSASDIDTAALTVPAGSACCEYKSRQALGKKMNSKMKLLWRNFHRLQPQFSI